MHSKRCWPVFNGDRPTPFIDGLFLGLVETTPPLLQKLKTARRSNHRMTFELNFVYLYVLLIFFFLIV